MAVVRLHTQSFNSRLQNGQLVLLTAENPFSFQWYI